MPEPQASANLYKKGDVIGDTYEVRGLLGKGGCGVVYLVLNRDSNTLCALKSFRDEFIADARARDAFEKEALMWVHLDRHPFILNANGVSKFSWRLFVEMDFVPPDTKGRVTLLDYLRYGEPVRQERVVEWAIQFCMGMEHAINRGIKCHRDIKPANIIICDSKLRISDFGLASAAEMAWKATTARRDPIMHSAELQDFSFSILRTDGKACCGTPGYVPPEVFRGEGSNISSDIYSFGLVLWQMATGSLMPPFAGASRDNIQAFMLATYERQMAGNAPIPSGSLGNIVEKCLQPKPLNRYKGFTDLREDLTLIFIRLTGKRVHAPEAQQHSSSFWNDKANSLSALGQRREALACYDKALALSPSDPITWKNKGLLLKDMGSFEEALYCHDRALALDSQRDKKWSASALTARAVCLAAIGRHKDALQCHDEALALDPHTVAAWNDKGVALNLAGHYREAVECFDKVIASDPQCAEAWYNKGLALGRLGADEDAIACYTRAIEIYPQFLVAFVQRGARWAARGRLEDAIQSYDAALAIDSLDSRVWYCKAHTLGVLKRYQESLDCYNRALAISPDSAESWFNKAEMEAQIGMPAASITSYEKFIEIAPVEYAEQVACARSRIMELLGR